MVDHIRAIAAIHGLVAEARHHAVIAVIAVIGLAAAVRDDGLVALAALEHFDAAEGFGEAVEAGDAGQEVEHHRRAGAAPVVACIAECIRACATVETVAGKAGISGIEQIIAVAAIDRITACAVVDGIIAHTAVNGIRPRGAGDAVIAVAHIDDLEIAIKFTAEIGQPGGHVKDIAAVVSAVVDHIIAAAAIQGFIADAGSDTVIAIAAIDDVAQRRGPGVQRVIAQPAIDRLPQAAGPGDRVIAVTHPGGFKIGIGFAAEIGRPGGHVEDVIAVKLAVVDDVIAGAAVHRLGADARGDEIIARAAIELVAAGEGASIEIIVAIAAIERVGARPGIKRVIAAVAGQIIIAAVAGQDVIGLVAEEEVIASAGGGILDDGADRDGHVIGQPAHTRQRGAVAAGRRRQQIDGLIDAVVREIHRVDAAAINDGEGVGIGKSGKAGKGFAGGIADIGANAVDRIAIERVARTIALACIERVQRDPVHRHRADQLRIIIGREFGVLGLAPIRHHGLGPAVIGPLRRSAIGRRASPCVVIALMPQPQSMADLMQEGLERIAVGAADVRAAAIPAGIDVDHRIIHRATDAGMQRFRLIGPRGVVLEEEIDMTRFRGRLDKIDAKHFFIKREGGPHHIGPRGRDAVAVGLGAVNRRQRSGPAGDVVIQHTAVGTGARRGHVVPARIRGAEIVPESCRQIIGQGLHGCGRTGDTGRACRRGGGGQICGALRCGIAAAAIACAHRTAAALDRGSDQADVDIIGIIPAGRAKTAAKTAADRAKGRAAGRGDIRHSTRSTYRAGSGTECGIGGRRRAGSGRGLWAGLIQQILRILHFDCGKIGKRVLQG